MRDNFILLMTSLYINITVFSVVEPFLQTYKMECVKAFLASVLLIPLIGGTSALQLSLSLSLHKGWSSLVLTDILF